MNWKDRAAAHPNLSTWGLLSIGFLAVLAVSARGVPLRPAQALALAAMSVAVAGLCAWIISWEAGRSEPDDPGPQEVDR